MFKMGRNGELVAVNGFDGSGYQPRYESRTSVFLGDMTREDLRIKAQVALRKQAEARMNQAARDSVAREMQRRIWVREFMDRKNKAVEVAGAKMLANAKNVGFLAGLADSGSADINPWVGSPFAGFGAAGEERINPDSDLPVDIVDAGLNSVKEYGVQNWDQDPAAVENMINASVWSQTEGKEVLQTLVDYPLRPSESVVGMPAASQASQIMTQDEIDKTQAVALAAQKSQAASEQATPTNYLQYGVVAIAAYFLLR